MRSIIKENPVFYLLLGLCTTLAVTTTFESAYMMGLSVIIVLFFTNLTISLIRKLIPENVKIPVFIIIIATFVTILDILIKAYLPELHASFGIYLPLITVNCIIFGRALSVASKVKVSEALKDAIKMGLGYLFAIALMALIREVLGTGNITIMNQISNLTGYRMVYNIIPASSIFPFTILTKPAGAFIVLGLIIAFFNKINKEEAK